MNNNNNNNSEKDDFNSKQNIVQNRYLQLGIIIFFVLLGVYDFVTDCQLLDYCVKVDKICKANKQEDFIKLIRTRVPMALPKLTRNDFATSPVCFVMDSIKRRDNDDKVIVTDYLVLDCQEDDIACYPIDHTLFQPAIGTSAVIPFPLNNTYFQCESIFEDAGNTGCGDNQNDLEKVVDEMYNISSYNRQVVKNALFQYAEDPQSLWDDDACWLYSFDGSSAKFCNINQEDVETIRLCEACSEIKTPSIIFLIISGPLFLYRTFLDIKEYHLGDAIDTTSLKYFNNRLKWLLLPMLFEDFPQLMFFLAIFNKGKCNSNLKSLSSSVFYPGFVTSLFSLLTIVPLYVVTNRRYHFTSHLYAILFTTGLALIAIGSGMLIGIKQEQSTTRTFGGGSSEGLGIFFLIFAILFCIIPSLVLFVKYRKTPAETEDGVELKSTDVVE